MKRIVTTTALIIPIRRNTIHTAIMTLTATSLEYTKSWTRNRWFWTNRSCASIALLNYKTNNIVDDFISRINNSWISRFIPTWAPSSLVKRSFLLCKLLRHGISVRQPRLLTRCLHEPECLIQNLQDHPISMLTWCLAHSIYARKLGSSEYSPLTTLNLLFIVIIIIKFFQFWGMPTRIHRQWKGKLWTSGHLR